MFRFLYITIYCFPSPSECHLGVYLQTEVLVLETMHMYFLFYWVGHNVHLFFSIRWLQQCLVVFNFIRNNFVRLYCDSCHISMCLKNFIKIGEFLFSHFNFEHERKYTISAYCACIISRKVKMQLKCKLRCVQCMEKVL